MLRRSSNVSRHEVIEKGRQDLHSIVISDEIETTMRLIGATSLDQLDERYVNCRKLEWELVNFSPRASKL